MPKLLHGLKIQEEAEKDTSDNQKDKLEIKEVESPDLTSFFYLYPKGEFQ